MKNPGSISRCVTPRSSAGTVSRAPIRHRDTVDYPTVMEAERQAMLLNRFIRALAHFDVRSLLGRNQTCSLS
jgi:hypothetical protein